MDNEAWNFFEDILPPEVAEIVFSFLSLEDIVYVSLVCKPWNAYFDTKDIWKKIIEHYYGELSPNNVDLTQSFRWKRIFITLHNAHSWAKTLSLKGTTMTFLSPRETLGNAQMGASGQYIHTLLSWIEIKMAGKLVQMKRDPLTIEEKLWIDKGFFTLQNCVMASHNGKYLIRGSDAKCYLVDGEKLASVDVGDYQATRLVVDRYADVFRGVNVDVNSCMATFNSRFVVLINHQRRHHGYNNNILQVIFDLQSRCRCVSTFYKDKQRNDNYSHYKNFNCNESTVSTPNGAMTAFASELDPELIVFFLAQYDEEKSIYRYVYYPKMVIWKHGKGLQEEKSLPFKNITDGTAATNFSEHIVDSHHWLCFDMGNYTRIIDLNNFANQYKLDLILPHRMWIPKKNKIILASSKKITVFDLNLNRWTSQMTCQNMVCAMTLNKSARILLVADYERVHAFHWETGKLIGSVRHNQHHNFTSIDTLHIAYDQVLIINGRLFLKMPAKLDM